MKKFAVALTCCLGFAAHAQIPAGYPADYAATVAAAEKEGKVVVYSSTDSTSTKPLLADFQALYPKIKVEYHDMNTTEIYSRFISENAANAGTADVLWSSSMDLQVKLVSDGYALTYVSPEAGKLPDWALWKNEAYGTTFEPIVFVYNKRLLQADEIPLTHADFTCILGAKAERFRNKVTSYDVEKSGLGFMLVTQDAMVSAAFWDLAKAMGAVSARYQSSTGTMMERIASGENLLGYNLLGAYAFIKAKKDPAIGISLSAAMAGQASTCGSWRWRSARFATSCFCVAIPRVTLRIQCPRSASGGSPPCQDSSRPSKKNVFSRLRIARRRAGVVTTQFCFCWRDSVCAQAKSFRSNLVTSAGVQGNSLCTARAKWLSTCRCFPTLARRWRSIFKRVVEQAHPGGSFCGCGRRALA
jgi:hypothetical protein